MRPLPPIHILALACVTALIVFAPAVSATITIAQGDVVYMNETVDLSLAVSWPDYTVAYCKGDYYGCLPPDQVIEITGNMHKYRMDPSVWNYGTYYRWDGTWHRGENSVAFTILPGTRPVTVFDEANQSVSNETVKGEYSASRSTSREYRHFIVAQGDDLDLVTRYSNQYNDTGSLWFFSFHDTMLDIPLERNESDYSHTFTMSETGKMLIGDYHGYLQFSGKNGFQDVYYDAVKNNLDTPYDDDIIPDVSLDITSPEQTEKKFVAISTPSRYYDDVLVPVTLEVVAPSIWISEVLQDDAQKRLYIRGTTTWREGTVITVKLDPDQFALAKDIRDHTWTTVTYGNISTLRTFDITIPYDDRELAIGEHDILATVDKNYLHSEVYYTFRVSDIFVVPEPTPERKRVLLDAGANPMPTMVTAVETAVTPAPTAPQNPVEPVVISTGGSYAVVEGEDTVAAPLTPLTTVPTRTPVVPTPTRDPNIHVPLPWWIAFAAVGIAAWRKR